MPHIEMPQLKRNPKLFYHKSAEKTTSDCGCMLQTVMPKLFSNGMLAERGMKCQKAHPDLFNTEISPQYISERGLRISSV